MTQLESPALKQNHRFIEEFIDSLILLSANRIRKYRYTLGKIDMELGVSFDQVTKQDLKDFVEEINTSDYEGWTKRDYRLITKKFFGWLRDPEFVSWIKLGNVKGRVGPRTY